MAATTFHSFPLLPGELRDQIWDDAVRPVGLRGVQYFTHHYDGYYDGVEGIFKHYMMIQHRHRYQGLGPALPVDDSSPPSWNNTQSTYSIDGGLWTACKESRAAMKRRYKFKTLLELRGSRGCREIRFSGTKLPALFPVEENGKRQYIAIQPDVDLAFLQHWSGSTLEHLSDFGPLSSIFPLTKYYFGGFQNIAVEYDPSWSVRELKLYHSDPDRQKFDNNRHGAYETLLEVTKATDGRRSNLWMVDPTVRIILTAFTEQQSSYISQREWENRVVFTANDYSYYEPHNWWETEEVVATAPADDIDHCAVRFTNQLMDLCEDELDRKGRFIDSVGDSKYEFIPRNWRYLVRKG